LLAGFEIKRIDLWSMFKVAFFVYAVLGLVVGMIYGFFMLVGGMFGSFIDEEFAGLGFLGGVIGLVLIPFFALLYGAIGSVFITIIGWVYNLAVGTFGGIRLTVDVDDAPATASATAPATASTTTPPAEAVDPSRVIPPGPNPPGTE